MGIHDNSNNHGFGSAFDTNNRRSPSQSMEAPVQPIFELDQFTKMRFQMPYYSEDAIREQSSDSDMALNLVQQVVVKATEMAGLGYYRQEASNRHNYERALSDSPVDYVIHKRFDDVVVGDVSYRFDLIQKDRQLAFRFLIDVEKTKATRKAKYLERYAGLAGADKETETHELLKELLGNLHSSLRADMEALLEKATAPKDETLRVPSQEKEEPRDPRERMWNRPATPFYVSHFFMGQLAQVCTTRVHPQLGLLILID